MSSDNSKKRRQLEQIYGKGCMFRKANIEDKIERLQTIKTYKVFLKETRYTGKKISQLERNMTYHHLRHRSEGGKTDIENGSVVNELAHRYLHSLPRQEEEIINNMLREYKLNVATMKVTEKGLEPRDAIQIEFDMSDCITIPVYDTTEKDMEKRRKFNRAKAKREFQDEIDDYYEHPEDYER